MATQEEIINHDKIIERVVAQFNRQLTILFRDFFLNLSSESNPSRIWISQQFQSIRNLVETQITQTDQIIQSNIQLNSDVMGSQIDPNTQSKLSQLKSESTQQVLNSIEEESNTIIDAIQFGLIAGIDLKTVVKDLQANRKRNQKRIVDTFRTALRNLDGAVLLLRSRIDPNLQFKYVGGIIPTSRDFCANHNGKIYTRKQIENIWRSSTWGGKAPGNPFIVRGGYNCRHMFVAIRNTNANP